MRILRCIIGSVFALTEYHSSTFGGFRLHCTRGGRETSATPWWCDVVIVAASASLPNHPVHCITSRHAVAVANSLYVSNDTALSPHRARHRVSVTGRTLSHKTAYYTTNPRIIPRMLSSRLMAISCNRLLAVLCSPSGSRFCNACS